MKTNKFTILIIGFILVTLGAFLKILKLEYTEYLIWVGLITELFGLVQLIKKSKKKD